MARSSQPARARKSVTPAPREHPAKRQRRRHTEASDELTKLAGRKAKGVVAALDTAASAYNAGRERDALRMLRPLAESYPEAAAVRELMGLCHYRLGNFRAAARELEAFVEISHGATEQHPVLMDCYRALRQFRKIDQCWHDLAAASPSAAIVTEGRIVLAGSLADRGRRAEAIALLEKRAASGTKRVQDHHARLWYALADLYERSGDIPRARALFTRVARYDRQFVDVAERLAALG